MLKIEKNIPIPSKGNRTPRYPLLHNTLKTMKIGDSVEFKTNAVRNNGKRYSDLGTSFRNIATSSYKYKMVERLSNDKNKIRIWRVE